MPVFRGVSHIHSQHSFDGKLPLAKVRDLLAGQGCEFILMSEHIEQLSLQQMQDAFADCRALSTPECCLIPGIEMDALNILVFGVGRAEEYHNLRDLVGKFRNQGAIVVLSHPVKIKRGIPAGIEEILNGIEIWNSRHDGKISPRTQNLELYHRLQQKNPELVPLAGLDFHSATDCADIYMEVEASEKSERAIIEGIRSGKVRIIKNKVQLGLNPRAFPLKRAAYSLIRDCLYRMNSVIRSVGVKPPNWLRRVARRVF